MHQFFKYCCCIIILFVWQQTYLFGQCPEAQFTTVNDPICQNENINPTNNSISSNFFYWNFCANDLYAAPDQKVITSMAQASQPIGFQTVKVGENWYAFVTNRGSSNILRIDYGTDLNNPNPIINNLGNPESALSLVEDIEVIEVNGEWVALVTQNVNPPNNNVYLLNFGADIENSSPTATNLGNFNIGTKIRGLTVGIDDGNIIVLLTRSDRKLTLVNYRESFSNTIDGSHILNTPDVATNTMFDVGVYRDCGQWYGVGPVSNNLSVFDFGTNLFSTPTVTNFAFTQISNTAFDVDFMADGDSTFVVIGNLSKPYTLINLGNLGNGDTPTLIDPSPLTNSPLSGFSIDFFEGSFIISGASTLRDLYRISYSADSDCGASSEFSLNESPENISYSIPGSHKISLATFNSNGTKDHASGFVTISEDSAPSIEITADDEQSCIANPVYFSVTGDIGDISTYEWDFGDGNISNVANPSHQYLSSGSYTVNLYVESNSGCTNNVSTIIDIYDEPMPSFSLAKTKYCALEELNIDNTTLDNFDGNIIWEWDFNGESVSNEKEPSYNFSTAGTKTITLTVDVLGCIASVSTEIEVSNSPMANFSFSQNCVFEEITFDDLSTGENISSYLWDFGDGNNFSGQNARHIYQDAGNYDVSLTVSDLEGCSNTFNQMISVYEQVIEDIHVNTAIENIPFEISPILTDTVDVTITAYEWDINSNIQNDSVATYTLESGVYEVILTVDTESGCTYVFNKNIIVEESTSPIVNFLTTDSVCSSETIDLINTSINASSYEWDFCPEDLLSSPDIVTLTSNLGFTFNSLKIVQDSNNFYGFGLTYNEGLYRLEFGQSLNNQPNIINLGNLGLLNQPEGIDIIKEGNQWVGLIGHNLNAGGFVTRLVWDNLTEVPVSENIGNLNVPNRLRDVNIVEQNGNIIAVLPFYNGNSIIRANFGSSLKNNLESDNIYNSGPLNNVAFPISISVIKDNQNWKIAIASIITKRVSIYDFGNDILNVPSELKSQVFDQFANLSKIKLTKQANQFIGYLSTTSGSLLIDFKSLAIGDNYEVIANANYSGAIAFDLLKNGGKYYILSSLGTISLYIFESDCSADISFSNLYEPHNFYNSSGTYPITLTATHPNGNTASITKEITVTNNQAPDITFSTGDNLCITNPIAFNSTSAADITSYNWDFGDGNTSTAENPNHTYTAAGTYAVKVSVTDANGCNNSFQDSIGVFEEPVPDFQATAQGSICSQKPIVFENLTTLPTDATFEWDLGDGSTSTVENPEHIYSEAGDYTVTQIIEMAGCLVERTKTITVNPGPAVAFQTANNCLGEILKFENTSQGEFLDSYQWDFGDGTQSTQANPSHSYDTAGVYNVQLTAFTTNGCDFTISQEVEIQPLALVNFDSEIACAGQPTQFMEQVNIEESNVTDYFWDFGVLGTQSDVSTEASPQFTYPAEGSYNVTLQVTTSDGCTSSGSQQIVVNSAPNAAFEFEETCLGQTRLFSPLDTANSINHFWELQNSQGEILQTAQSAFFSYLFTEAGNYQLTYRQENESLCSQATTQTIEINEQPVPDFTWGTACVGELVSFENLTALNGNRLKNYNWSIEGTMFSSDLAPQYTFEESGNYQLTLEVETQGGCIQNISKNLLVSSKPTAFFELEQSIGAYPFALNLMMQDNPNEEIVEVFWILNEDTISNSSELNHTITEPGTYLLGLTVINEAGCKNEYYEQIKVREPSLDVSLSNLRIKKDQEFTSFILNISNRGSLVPERIDLTIDFGEYSLTESLEAQIYPEENRNFSLSTRLTDEQLRGLSKICISASPKAGEGKDANPQNNRICTNIENGFKVMDIYPNPTINQFTIPLIIPENETIAISMEDSNGRQVKVYNYSLEAGYNEVQIQRENLSPGIYFLRFRYQGQEKIKKIIFQ